MSPLSQVRGWDFIQQNEAVKDGSIYHTSRETAGVNDEGFTLLFLS